MAVQKIIGKRIIKHDVNSPNFKPPEPKIEEVIDQIIFSYERFFADLSSYNFVYFKKKADLMGIN